MQAEHKQAQKPELSQARLSGADSFFLDIESDECTMNMGLLMIVEAGEDAALEQRVRDVVSEDTPLTRTLKKKIQTSLWNLDHPCWVVDSAFNVDKHIVRHELRKSSNSRAFNNLVAQIVQNRLSLNRPLWEVHIISGLDNGESAIVGKLHHSLADGATGMLLIQQLMGINSPRAGQQPPDNKAATAADAAIYSNKLARPAARLGVIGRLFFSLVVDITLRLFVLNQYIFERRLKKASLAAPYTRFNTLLTSERSYTHGQLSLADTRKICARFNCARNDVFLAIISGALRRYLLEHRTLPGRSLYTGLPMVLLGDQKRAGAANQLTFYRSSLATNIVDPITRLQTIKYRHERSAVNARNHWRKRLLERMTILPPRAIRSIIALYIKLLDKGVFRPNVNVVSTLLPGPAKTTDIAGRPVTGIYPVSIPYHGAGLFISAIRYRDELQFGIIADQLQLPDPDHLADLMQASLTELLDLAEN